jgi:hypothetical protein
MYTTGRYKRHNTRTIFGMGQMAIPNGTAPTAQVGDGTASLATS